MTARDNQRSKFPGLGVRTIVLTFSLGILLCSTIWAQDPPAQATVEPSATTYTFQNIVYPGDTFVQLLGINDWGLIAGYHGSGATSQPNKGFLLTLPNHFAAENFPNSAQTQVTGVDVTGRTVGFYVAANGNTFGFFHSGVGYRSVWYPGTTFNQLLGINNLGQSAGYYADSAGNDHGYTFAYTANLYQLLTFVAPWFVSVQQTGINDLGEICGFYVDGNGVNHGFTLNGGTFTTLDYPGSTFTQALGLNNSGWVVGSYMDSAGLSHGFVYSKPNFVSIDDPDGVGTTTVNGINRYGKLVGFYVDSNGNTDGFVATP